MPGYDWFEVVQRRDAFGHPVLDDLAVLDAEQAQGGDALTSTGGWDTEALPLLRATKRPLRGDPVAFRDQGMDLDVTVGEGGSNLGARPLGAFGPDKPSRGGADVRARSNQLVHCSLTRTGKHLIEKAARYRLVDCY